MLTNLRNCFGRRFRPASSSPRHAAGRSAVLQVERLEAREVLSPATYNGGPLLQHVEIETVYYSPAWVVDQGLRNQSLQFDDFFRSITTSSYMHLLEQYRTPLNQIGTGGFLDHDYTWGQLQGTVHDIALRSVLLDQISSHLLQAPSANRLYVIFAPPNVTVVDDRTGANSDTDFNGYHYAFQDGAGHWIYYAVIAYRYADPVTGLSGFQRMTVAASHEMAEAITDPQPFSGWIRDHNEIGDGGERLYGTVGGYTVQALWSNQSSAFVVPNAIDAMVSVNSATGVLTVSGDRSAMSNNGALTGLINNANGLPAALSDTIRITGDSSWLTVTVNNDTTLVATSSFQSILINGGARCDFIGIDFLPFNRPLTVNSGDGDDTFNALGDVAGSPLQLNGGAGNDDFVIGAAYHTLNSFASPVTIDGGTGTNSLGVKDQDTLMQELYDVWSNGLQRWYAGWALHWSNLQAVILECSQGQDGSDYVDVTGTNPGLTLTVNAGSGGANLNLTGRTDFLDDLQGPVIFNGANGLDRLYLYDQNDIYPDTYTVTPTTITRVVFGGVTYNNVEAVTLNAGSGNSLFLVTPPSPGCSLTLNAGPGNDSISLAPTNPNPGSLSIDGQAGNDTLDCSAFTTGVTVNLATGLASGLTPGNVSRIAGIENVSGGAGDDILIGDGNDNVLIGNAGNDILVGGAGNDTLDGGPGRNVLIGGLGGDRLIGGGDDDLLIGGYTRFDNDVASLSAILREWAAPLTTYQSRVGHLTGTLSGGSNGSVFLTAGTVFDDGTRDQLTGNAGTDWFFANLATDILPDWSPTLGERLN